MSEFELTDEQLEAVTGGDGSVLSAFSPAGASQTALALGLVNSGTTNFSFLNTGTLTQTGSSNDVKTGVDQKSTVF